MRTGCFIPIKSNSERVRGKNFRTLAGRPLYEHIIAHALEADAFDEVIVDTDSQQIEQFAEQAGARTIRREPWLASNQANGNDLIVHHAETERQFEIYFQLFATAPTLSPATIRRAATELKSMASAGGYDSIFTATVERGWFWMNELPVNFRPGVLPRSQDAQHVLKETTGLYGVTREALLKYRCRVGARPYAWIVDPIEAIDLDSEADFKFAEAMLAAEGARR